MAEEFFRLRASGATGDGPRDRLGREPNPRRRMPPGWRDERVEPGA
jgi:hypothetical protein